MTTKKLKIVIANPPLESSKGTPLLTQNRQFQWFTNPLTAYFIYPLIMASAATLLKSKGYQVCWMDAVALGWSYQKFVNQLKQEKPDLVAIETKTPVIKLHWQIINSLKKQIPNLKTVLVGDHVTALPEESLKKSKTDFILTGGDYDFALLNLCQHLQENEKLEPGVWYWQIKNNQKIISNTGQFSLKHNLDDLPFIDRDLTKWPLYAYKNSNFYSAPGTYTMFGRDCWWGRCSFCSWTTLFPGRSFRQVSVNRALDEVEYLVKNYSVKEIMDDSGTFPVGNWLRQFCQGLINRGLNKKVKINCNLRFNAGLTQKDYNLMGRAGFRFILYGLESAQQSTLNKINKNSKVALIEPVLTMAVKAGLKPHITVMIGYPWETETDIQQTLSLAKNLFKKGLVFTMQATIVIPYPGTPLFKTCQEKGLLKTLDWDQYDMRRPIMKTAISNSQLSQYVRSLYSSFIFPQFIFKTILSLRNLDDLKYISFQGLKFFSKLLDFRPR